MNESVINLPVGCESRCPGCSHRRLSAAASEAQKLDWLRRALTPWAAQLTPMQTVTDAARWNYRRKVCLSAQWREIEGWQLGLWRRDELIPIPDCPVHAEPVRMIIRWLMRTLPPGPDFPLAFFVQSGAQATLILKTHALPDPGWFNGALQAELAASGLKGLWLHRHPATGRRLFARNGWTLLWGQPRSRDGLGLVYGPTAFQQQIPALYQQVLDAAEAFLIPDPGQSIADLYCGIGATLQRWTRRGARVMGVELGGEAVECAGLNAPDAAILRGKCAERIPQLRAWTPATGTRLLYVNPPRTGLEPEVLAWAIHEFRPSRLAYLSCSAGTLGRDLQALTAAGYAVNALIPYDFFPQTRHVETLALLQDRG
ncbi:MAG: class I SAM-dependent RNA methyltransferase [Candidatus Contendobacter sp.]|jgi:23S rRNA (uracil1939-C5)-methyltransferase|nr:class I SAM-dependent RNA methyltransferase [Gammaproteobacteria bacterium]MCC8993421.1 class I SAM-dependent RNA methyltransferase [Candidatus Contendobacter sp.]